MMDSSYENEKLQRITFQQTMNTAAMIKAMGMQAENERSIRESNKVLYLKQDFDNILDEYGIGHNAHHYMVVG